jgi:hypothetical protein
MTRIIPFGGTELAAGVSRPQEDCYQCSMYDLDLMALRFDAKPCYEPTSEGLRFLPEGPRVKSQSS